VNDIDDAPFVIEAGPDSFLTQKPWALQLAHSLGLEDRLLGTNDTKRTVYVLHKGKPLVMPDGVMMMVPTKFMPFVTSPLISPLGKLRMGLDLLIPPKVDEEDETLAEFVGRRLGKEALDKIAEPMMAGIYNASADMQSVMATFPRFRTIEKEHGSLTRGMIAARQQREAAKANPGKQTSAFVSFYGGTDEIIQALVEQLNGDLRLNAAVQAIEQQGADYAVQLADGSRLDADVVILATPAYTSADLLREAVPQAALLLDNIRYVSTGTISLAYREADIRQPLDGFGLLIPASEQRPINAITVSSTKFDQRAPDGYVLMRVFFGGSRSPETMHLDDDALRQTVRDQLKHILGIEAAPLFDRIYRWWNANPQYDVGHLERVDAIEAALPQGVYVTGSPYRGVGLPDCVHQAQQTAEHVLANYSERITST
jgi:oxygen-dependent protoporphyrinogen oxidase